MAIGARGLSAPLVQILIVLQQMLYFVLYFGFVCECSVRITVDLQQKERKKPHRVGSLKKLWYYSFFLNLLFRWIGNISKMERLGLMQPPRSSLLIALAPVLFPPWVPTTSLITIVSGIFELKSEFHHFVQLSAVYFATLPQTISHPSIHPSHHCQLLLSWVGCCKSPATEFVALAVVR